MATNAVGGLVVGLFAAGLSVGGCSGAVAGKDVVRAAAPAGFWDHWGDGKAEIASYSLTTPRYGALRSGTAVLVFVTEDFTEGQRVKSDGGHGDEYPVLKLNDIRHFQTGIYDYNVMTSTFSRIDGKSPIGHPVKVSMSMQEWCGHAYEQLLSRGAQLQFQGHSYFDGEGDHTGNLPLPADGLLAEAIPFVARGLLGAWPAVGAEVKIPVLPTLVSARYAHAPQAWTDGVLRRKDVRTTVTVPAGTFETTAFEVAFGGTTTTYAVEAASPHRIIRWERTDGEVAELVAVERLPYWTLNKEGDEKVLSKLGLAPAPVAAVDAATP